MNEFKNIKFPAGATVFDFFIDTETKQFSPWTEKIPKFELDSDIPLQVMCSIPLDIFFVYKIFTKNYFHYIVVMFFRQF